MDVFELSLITMNVRLIDRSSLLTRCFWPQFSSVASTAKVLAQGRALVQCYNNQSKSRVVESIWLFSLYLHKGNSCLGENM